MKFDASIVPEDEPQRMAAVKRYDILDTPPDGAFDRITALAARRFNVPISIISIVDEDRIWFKSHHGLNVTQIGREAGLCASAILSTDPYVLPDAAADIRSLANPLVAGDFGLRFYAAVPLTTTDGYNLGTLCVIDKVSRPIDQAQIDDLKDLASIVIDQLELRLAARRAVGQAQLMQREIDHRVMNSLQFISGLLTMQSRSTETVDAVAALEMAANRVSAVARVHRHFYTGEDGQASCVKFLNRLCEDMSGIVGRDVEVQGDEGDVPTTWIQPIGLIVNELVTNAAKHGAGRIEVTYRQDKNRHELAVSDEGPGNLDGFEPAASLGLGMKVVTALVRQLNGRLDIGRNPKGLGNCFIVNFAPA